jgi:hypothetical protein
MKKVLIGLFIIMLSLTACTRQPATQSTSTPQPSRTHTITPSTTPTITNTQKPTLTPSTTPLTGGTLNEEGPWLMYRHEDGSIYLINPDGTGKFELPFVTDKFKYQKIKSSGKLLATNTLISESEYNYIYLDIYSLPDFTKIQSINVDSYLRNPPSDHKVDTTKGSSNHYWSPDGRYLAFSAIIDGPSMDLYVYDTVTDEIKRLTWGENAIGEIEWSPDSQWIVHEEATEFHGYTVKAIWASASDGSGNKWLYEPHQHAGQHILGWINSQQFVSIEASWEGPGYARLTNVATQESISLYEGYFGIYGPALDPTNKLLAFITIGDTPVPQDQNGLYLMYLDDPYPIFFSKVLILHEFDKNLGVFTTDNSCEDEEGKAGYVAFSSSKAISCIDPSYLYTNELSPDSQWILQPNGELHSYPELEYIFTYANARSSAIWRPDSQGFFVYTSKTLEYIPLDTLTPILIDDQLGFSDSKYSDASPKWIGE